MMKPKSAVAALVCLAASAACAQQAVVLVRHAELANTTGIDARQVALSPEGEARAARLAGLLEKSGVSAIYATDFLRTQATAAPTAKLVGREVTVQSKGGFGDFVAQLQRDHPQEVVLVVGHTDTLPGIIKAFGVPQEVRIDSSDYGNVFVLVPHPGAPPGLLRLRY